MKRFASVIILLISTILLGQTVPSVPAAITYQGRITDAVFPLGADGEYEMTFLIFDALTGGNLLWSETQPGVVVAAGVYKVNLGEAEPIPFSALNGRNAYLEVRIFGETIGPRSRIVSAPFALKSEGEVSEGAVILGELSGDTAITNLGYTQQGDTIGSYYLYKKNAYNPFQPRVPQRISYQGRLLPADGGTVGTTANFTFTIFDADTAGASLWTETQNSVPLDQGLFSVELGAVNPIYPTHLSDKDLWLAVAANGEALLPREKLASVGYALKVESPVPEGGIVLSSAGANPGLTAKKFTATGTSLKGYYLFRKNVFSSADSSVPLLINYQGRLRDIGGGLISGSTVDLHFSIFDTLAGNTMLWSETVSGIGLDTGIFNTLLGGSVPITPATFTGPNAFLEVKVIQGATVETLSPRQRLTSVPFAFQAEGTMPPGAFLLDATANDPNLTGSGFQMTGDTVNEYYVYGKTEVDTVPPQIDIVSPLSGMTSSDQIDINITFSDALSGINLSTLSVYLNNTNITSMLTVSETGASGTVTGLEGGNRIYAVIGDNAGNAGNAVELVLVETGSAPTIDIISPQDGSSVYTNTPVLFITYNDTGCGVDLSTLQIILDGFTITERFYRNSAGAIYEITADNQISNGPHTLWAAVSDFFGNASTAAISNFIVANSYTNPTLASIDPNFTIGGDTVTLTGTGFGNTVGLTKVYFSGTLGKVQAEVISSSSNQIKARVPGGAITGKVWVENTVNGSPLNSDEVDFILGLPYAYIANRQASPVDNKITVIDYRNNSVVASINLPGSGNRLYGADVTPDGRWLFVTDVTTNTVTIIDTLDNHIVRNINLLCKTPNPSQPFAIAISPDGNRAFAVSNNKILSILEIRKALDPLAGDTTVVTNKPFSAYGSSFQDIEVTPDGQQIVIGTDGSGSQGYVIEINVARSFEFYTTSPYSNRNYLDVKQLQLPAGAGQNPQGVGMLPQRTSDISDSWMAIITNLGSGSADINGVILNLPDFSLYDTIDINRTGLPVCYGGKDVAISNLGERAFIGFYSSNNIGMLESLTVAASNEIAAATAARAGCPPICSGPGPREAAYTPYLDKVIVPIYASDLANSKVMILNADTASIPVGFTGTIPASAYSFVTATSINAPEGVGLYPLFDRDNDNISDLIEACNIENSWWSVLEYFKPTIPDDDPSLAGGTSVDGYLRGGIKLPQEGIGYYHFHGTTEGPNGDNWGTLKLIKVIEQVGREWNQRHPNGPRIGIGDVSLEDGGQFCWWEFKKHWPPIEIPCHQLHQQGIDADIRYVRSDGKEMGFAFIEKSGPFPEYSPSLTQELVDLLCEAGVYYIYADSLQRDDLIQPPNCEIDRTDASHYHHFHIRIRL
ncbi:MAG TPA: penicillin-insensitive murein endopeptidase [bacterium]|nr:penicillin-insensitive murein endopeptidase [bacterium]